MKLLALLPVLFLASSCAAAERLQAFLEPPELPAPEEPVASQPPPPEDKSKTEYPVIRFEGQVTAEAAKQFQELLSTVTELGAKTIIVELNTPGGDVDSGFLISKAIEDSEVPIVCLVDAQAHSMGFYILQSCPIRIMTTRSAIMEHHAYFPSVGGALDIPTLKDLLANLTATNKGMTRHECRRLTIPFKLCAQKIAASWWMDWVEAVKVGAVDGAVDTAKEVYEAYRTTGQPPPFLKP